MEAQAFKQTLISLLAEAYGLSDAPTGFFLDSGRSGLFGQIEKIDAKVASDQIEPDHETIAGHCRHLLYTFEIFLAFENGERPTPDWAASWVPQIVDEAEWDKLRAALKSAYDLFIEKVQARTEWPQPAVGAGMMMLAHTVYHVGVIDKMITISSK